MSSASRCAATRARATTSIRREFDIAEGDAFNRVLIDRAERRLKQPRLFQRRPHLHRARLLARPRRSSSSTSSSSRPASSRSASAIRRRDGIVGDISLTETQLPRPRLQYAGRRSAAARTRATTSSASPTPISSAGASRPASTSSAANTRRTTSAPTTTRRPAAALTFGFPITENFTRPARLPDRVPGHRRRRPTSATGRSGDADDRRGQRLASRSARRRAIRWCRRFSTR